MKILADESVDFGIIKVLRKHGFIVRSVYMRKDSPPQFKLFAQINLPYMFIFRQFFAGA